MQKSERINLRVTPAEKEAWEKAASGKVSEWLRELANHATREIPAFEIAPIPAGVSSTNVVVASTPKKSRCPRALYHQKGVYCKSCGS